MTIITTGNVRGKWKIWSHHLHNFPGQTCPGNWWSVHTVIHVHRYFSNSISWMNLSRKLLVCAHFYLCVLLLLCTVIFPTQFPRIDGPCTLLSVIFVHFHLYALFSQTGLSMKSFWTWLFARFTWWMHTNLCICNVFLYHLVCAILVCSCKFHLHVCTTFSDSFFSIRTISQSICNIYIMLEFWLS